MRSILGTPSSEHFVNIEKKRMYLLRQELYSPDVSECVTEKIKCDLSGVTVELLLLSKYSETDAGLIHAQTLQLLKFCLRTYFTLKGSIYEQVKGTPISSPIFGLIAEVVLQQHRSKFRAWYVDDTFVVIERDKVHTLKERLNSVNSGIQFTTEVEENTELAFLDVLLCHNDCDDRFQMLASDSVRKNLSEAVGRLLAPLEVEIAHGTDATIRHLIMKPKDPQPRQETTGVATGCNAVADKATTSEKLEDLSRRKMPNTQQQCGDMISIRKLRLIRRGPDAHSHLMRPKFS
ncbi:unnamed protein product [Dibothriocephalus latus]|uniref:Reverse transcriptase domain-containing protein n=1 Tax=Dibothriocephalus latus TaxID=60516 RepID=A0A3P6RF90_DIBLA|nr:unnamed protein product [Dibothriocephalus latus]